MYQHLIELNRKEERLIRGYLLLSDTFTADFAHFPIWYTQRANRGRSIMKIRVNAKRLQDIDISDHVLLTDIRKINTFIWRLLGPEGVTKDYLSEHNFKKFEIQEVYLFIPVLLSKVKWEIDTGLVDTLLNINGERSLIVNEKINLPVICSHSTIKGIFMVYPLIELNLIKATCADFLKAVVSLETKEKYSDSNESHIVRYNQARKIYLMENNRQELLFSEFLGKKLPKKVEGENNPLSTLIAFSSLHKNSVLSSATVCFAIKCSEFTIGLNSVESANLSNHLRHKIGWNHQDNKSYIFLKNDIFNLGILHRELDHLHKLPLLSTRLLDWEKMEKFRKNTEWGSIPKYMLYRSLTTTSQSSMFNNLPLSIIGKSIGKCLMTMFMYDDDSNDVGKITSMHINLYSNEYRKAAKNMKITDYIMASTTIKSQTASNVDILEVSLSNFLSMKRAESAPTENMIKESFHALIGSMFVNNKSLNQIISGVRKEYGYFEEFVLKKADLIKALKSSIYLDPENIKQISKKVNIDASIHLILGLNDKNNRGKSNYLRNYEVDKFQGFVQNKRTNTPVFRKFLRSIALRDFEKNSLGYTFVSKKNLDIALSPGKVNRHQFNRLEILGDSVIEVLALLFAKELALKIKKACSHSLLHEIKSRLLDTENLALIFTHLRLYRFLDLNEMQGGQIEPMQEYLKRTDFDTKFWTIWLKSGGKTPKVMADVVEALFGAVFLDGGFPAVCATFGRIILPMVCFISKFYLAVYHKISSEFKREDPNMFNSYNFQTKILTINKGAKMIEVKGDSFDEAKIKAIRKLIL